MTALDRSGKSLSNFFLKRTMKEQKIKEQIRFLLIERTNHVAEKNERILFSAEIRVVGSYTDRLLKLIFNNLPVFVPLFFTLI